MHKYFLIISIILYSSISYAVCTLSKNVGEITPVPFVANIGAAGVPTTGIVSARWVLNKDSVEVDEMIWGGSNIRKFFKKNFFIDSAGSYEAVFYYDAGEGETSCSILFAATSSTTQGIDAEFTAITKESSPTVPIQGESPYSVKFFNLSKYAGIYGKEKIRWDFGDGKFSEDEDPVHEYTKEGVYDVSLTVIDTNGGSFKETKTGYATVVKALRPDFSYEEMVGVLFSAPNLFLVDCDNDFQGTKDGKTWHTAYSSLNTAIEAAKAVLPTYGDAQIWISTGYYGVAQEKWSFNTTLSTMSMDITTEGSNPNKISIVGGFNTTSRSFYEKNLEDNPVVIDAAFGINSVDTLFSVNGNVLFSNVILLGAESAITLEGGKASVEDSVFSYNSSVSYDKAAITSNNTTLRIKNSTFSNNFYAGSSGVYFSDSFEKYDSNTLVVTDSTFTKNLSHFSDNEFVRKYEHDASFNVNVNCFTLVNQCYSGGYVVVNGDDITEVAIGSSLLDDWCPLIPKYVFNDTAIYFLSISDIGIITTKVKNNNYVQVKINNDTEIIVSFAAESFKNCEFPVETPPEGYSSGAVSFNSINNMCYVGKCNFSDNFSLSRGSCVGVGGAVYIDNSEFNRNKSLYGGCFSNMGGKCYARIEDSEFLFNEATFGGILYVEDNSIGRIDSKTSLFSENFSKQGSILMEGLDCSIVYTSNKDTFVDNYTFNEDNNKDVLYTFYRETEGDSTSYFFRDSLICNGFGSTSEIFFNILPNLLRTTVDSSCDSLVQDYPIYSYKIKYAVEEGEGDPIEGNTIDVKEDSYNLYEPVRDSNFQYSGNTELIVGNFDLTDGTVVEGRDTVYDTYSSPILFKNRELFGTEVSHDLFCSIPSGLDEDLTYTGTQDSGTLLIPPYLRMFKDFYSLRVSVDEGEVELTSPGYGNMDIGVKVGTFTVKNGLLYVDGFDQSTEVKLQEGYLRVENDFKCYGLNDNSKYWFEKVGEEDGLVIYEAYNYENSPDKVEWCYEEAKCGAEGSVYSVIADDVELIPDFYPSGSEVFTEERLEDSVRIDLPINPMPIYLHTIEDVQKIGNEYSLDGYYIMACDIDASETEEWEDGFIPIGSLATPFTGTFDGNGFRLDKVYIMSKEDCCGLFSVLGGTAVVKNFTISMSLITTGDYAGAICGINQGAISNCSVVRYQGVGGVQGYDNVGGVVGYNFGSITKVRGTIDNVEGHNSVGGFVGYMAAAATISNSFVRGLDTSYVVSGQTNVGGFCGYNESGGLIDDSYCVFKVESVVEAGGGGFVGVGGEPLNVTNSFWDKDISIVVDSDGGTGKTTIEMMDDDTFLAAGWDFVDIWVNVDGVSYPDFIEENLFTHPFMVKFAFIGTCSIPGGVDDSFEGEDTFYMFDDCVTPISSEPLAQVKITDSYYLAEVEDYPGRYYLYDSTGTKVIITSSGYGYEISAGIFTPGIALVYYEDVEIENCFEDLIASESYSMPLSDYIDIVKLGTSIYTDGYINDLIWVEQINRNSLFYYQEEGEDVYRELIFIPRSVSNKAVFYE